VPVDVRPRGQPAANGEPVQQALALVVTDRVDRQPGLAGDVADAERLGAGVHEGLTA